MLCAFALVCTRPQQEIKGDEEKSWSGLAKVGDWNLKYNQNQDTIQAMGETKSTTTNGRILRA